MSYLERYDATPDADKWRLARGWIDSASDVLPFFKELREKRPVLVTPACTLLARYDDIIEALNMPKIFTVALYWPKMTNGIYLMAHDDDALHYREKSIMQGFLNRDDVPRVRTMTAALGKRFLDAANGKIEAVGGYTRLVPATLVQDYFGLSGGDVKDLMEWSYWNQVDNFYNQPFDLRTDAERKEISDKHEAANQALSKFIAILAAKRLPIDKLEEAVGWFTALWRLIKKLFTHQDEPASDTIVDRMLRSSFPHEMEFDLIRVGINISGLLIGTVETTSQATAQVIQFFLDRPELLAKAKAAAEASDPSAFDGYVWEALRFVPISPYMFRQLSQDYVVGKGEGYATTIPKGTNVLTLTQSAMFDERAYERADEFIPERNWYNHFVFGYGSHECLGKYVGMVLIPEMVRQMLLRPGLRQEAPIDYKGEHLPQEYRLAWNA
ncbi:MAG TPA: cytochrome P450 [Rhizomicrobium sp.]|nr:cytochrome P450 [Rhizomicrobium sp.]